MIKAQIRKWRDEANNTNMGEHLPLKNWRYKVMDKISGLVLLSSIRVTELKVRVTAELARSAVQKASETMAHM